jgi:hypothetical protein
MSMQHTFVGLLACVLAAAVVAPAQSTTNFDTVGEALQAKNLTILLAAVQVREWSQTFTQPHSRQHLGMRMLQTKHTVLVCTIMVDIKAAVFWHVL